MKVIVAGSRDIINNDIVFKAIEDSGIKITEIVCGMARGVDSCGYNWAKLNSIAIKEFPADWNIGRSAGHIRNQQMADYAEALILVWDGKSPGSKSMKDKATAKKLQIFEVII